MSKLLVKYQMSTYLWLNVGQALFGQMSVGIAFGQMSVGQALFGQMSVGQVVFGPNVCRSSSFWPNDTKLILKSSRFFAKLFAKKYPNPNVVDGWGGEL